MPCAKTQAHGKPDFCRVPVETAYGKRLAHVKPSLYRMSGKNTHGIGPTHGKHKPIQISNFSVVLFSISLGIQFAIIFHVTNTLLKLLKTLPIQPQNFN